MKSYIVFYIDSNKLKIMVKKYCHYFFPHYFFELKIKINDNYINIVNIHNMIVLKNLEEMEYILIFQYKLY